LTILPAGIESNDTGKPPQSILNPVGLSAKNDSHVPDAGRLQRAAHALEERYPTYL
jgi:hypothetical protein